MLILPYIYKESTTLFDIYYFVLSTASFFPALFHLLSGISRQPDLSQFIDQMDLLDSSNARLLASASLQASTALSDTWSRQPTTCARPPSKGPQKGKLSDRNSNNSGNSRNNESITWRGNSTFYAGLGGGMAAYFGGIRHVRAHPMCPLLGALSRRKKSSKSQRILILMSDTGGGHRASAEALKSGFQELYGSKYHIDIVDVWSHHTPWPYNELPKSYSFMVKYDFLWRFGFTTTQPRFIHVPISTAASLAINKHIGEAYEKYSPDLVVSVHPLMQHVPLRILRGRERAGLSPPTNFATVVTDLTTCHNTWFHRGVDRCYVATPESERQALSLGLKPEQLRLFGLPIRPAFSRSYPSKKRLRRHLGMHASAPAVLLVGGGEGMGPVEKTVSALAENVGGACQVVVICGRNRQLVERLSSKSYPHGMHVLVKGFVDNMPELMYASDLIITKAGPGTISEALICGLPMILNAFIPCQEEGNIPYVTENKVGVFEKDPNKVAELVKKWFGEAKEEFKEMAKRAKALGKPDSLFHIVEDLSGLVGASPALHFT